MTCKRCYSSDVARNGWNHGKQVYRCKTCGKQFTDTKRDKEPLSVREKRAIRSLVELPVPVTVLAEAFGVNRSTIYRVIG